MKNKCPYLRNARYCTYFENQEDCPLHQEHIKKLKKALKSAISVQNKAIQGLR